MLGDTEAFSGFAARDLSAARRFYEGVLGVDCEEQTDGLLTLHLGSGHDVLVYEKPDHAPANFTILNFPVAEIDPAVDRLIGEGVEMERYEGFDQDEKGISRGLASGRGPDIAWFTDPSGNILSVLQAP